MEKNVILHIGAPKTGTSYIQRWMEQNQEALNRSGITVHKTELAHRLAVEFYDGRIRSRSDVIGIFERFRTCDVLGELDAQHKNLLSSEYFFHVDPKRLAERLERHDIRVSKIICLLRRQDILAASGYAQDVKALGRSGMPPHAVFYSEQLDYAALYRSWANAFPETSLHFLNYDRVSSDLLSALKSLLGSVAHTNDGKDKENISLTAEMTEIARLLNERGEQFVAHKLIDAQGDGPPFSFSPEVTQAYERAYLASNNTLASLVPTEFDDFAKAGWAPRGVDLTGRISKERVKQVLDTIGQNELR